MVGVPDDRTGDPRRAPTLDGTAGQRAGSTHRGINGCVGAMARTEARRGGENLLLDKEEKVRIADFGLSATPPLRSG